MTSTEHGKAGASRKTCERDEAALEALVEALGAPDRKTRQAAAHAVASVARTAPEQVAPHADALARAAGRPEAQTRWEALDALGCVAPVNPQAAGKALEQAEDALFDEESGTLRLAALRYLVALGSVCAQRSAEVWPFLDEAIQCYHGDPEFDDMLAALVDFAHADLDPGVRAALAARLAFDARNTRGALGAHARQIEEILT